MKRSLLCLALAALLPAVSALAGSPNNTPDVIGEVIDLTVARESAAFSGQVGRGADAAESGEMAELDAELVWSTELHFKGADYIAPHFSRFDLPRGAYVVVRSLDGERSWTYRGRGKNVPNPDGGFWGIHVYGFTAVVELYSARPLAKGSVAIDRFARGFSADELARARNVVHPLSLCGADDSLWARCYQTSEAAAYTKGKAVARLMINGTGACTGWLLGNQGHVVTNQHCIGTASDAANTTFEFMAEGATCTTACDSWGGCPGTIVASTSTLVKNSATYDYALVKLPSNPTGTYGYLQLRSTGATVGERIYIPQHPAAWGKKIAMKDGTANATISGLSEPPCAGGSADVGYNADTQGGSSGSPVLGYSDNLVVALHHCGTCPNRAVPIQSVISDLGSSLPPGSTGGGGPVTYSISGNAGTTGATVATSSGSATSDASSNYAIAGLSAGTYTVTPSKSGCTFSPASRSVTVGPNATGISFTATCAPPPGDTQLTSGVTLGGQSVALGAWKYYYITVPAGATNLTFTTSGASADVDIYTQSGAKPTSSSYVCRPYTGSGNETCSATNPAAGTWWLGVYGYAAGSYSVTGTVTTSVPVTTLFNDGFEAAGWSTAQVSGTAGAWTFPASGTHPAASPHGGTKLGVFNSYTSASGSQTRVYRTAGFSVGSSFTSVSLKFWMYHDTGYSTSADKVQAQVSTNGTTWTNVGTAVNRYTGSTGWAQATVDLTAYKGQTVYLGFVGISAYGNDEYLDDVTVTGQ